MPGKVGDWESGVLSRQQGQRSQGWPAWGTHAGGTCTLAESPWTVSWMWSLVHSRCLINGLIRVGVGHSTEEHVTAGFL